MLEREEIYPPVGLRDGPRRPPVDIFVRKLRQKLERPPQWRYIHTHFGIGYRFAAEPLIGSAGPSEAESPAVPDRRPAAPAGTPELQRDELEALV